MCYFRHLIFLYHYSKLKHFIFPLRLTYLSLIIHIVFGVPLYLLHYMTYICLSPAILQAPLLGKDLCIYWDEDISWLIVSLHYMFIDFN